jgi:aspartate ammonia-lyase
VEGITANEAECRRQVMNSVALVTALAPLLGYETTSAIAKEALATGKSVHTIVVEEQKRITQAKWDELFSFENLIRPRFINT